MGKSERPYSILMALIKTLKIIVDRHNPVNEHQHEFLIGTLDSKFLENPIIQSHWTIHCS